MFQECKSFFYGYTLPEWRALYRSRTCTPREIFRSFAPPADDLAWITRVDATLLEQQLDWLDARLEQVHGDLQQLPFFGIPFAVKDNIDVAGWPTTAACAAFAYTASEDATVVLRLRQAGAIMVGKTNLDQFATGLTGTRSPYGIVPNTFRPEYICGGSSSGSASVVARGIVPFALGTDTAGSGRVPAGMNNIVGLKPTRGWLSARGVVPACRTLDCVSIFALTVEDAAELAHIAAGFDADDPYSRAPSMSAPARFSERPRLGVPRAPEFFGDREAEAAYGQAIERARAMGAELTPIDFTPFAALAALLYEGPWIAERFAVIERVWNETPEAIDPTVRAIIEGAKSFSAADAFKAEYRRAELTRVTDTIMATVDAMIVPTVPMAFTIEEALQKPFTRNAMLGIYTNFANFADLCALALPSDLRPNGIPSGVTLLAPAWHDYALADLGLRWQRHRLQHEPPVLLGATDRPYTSSGEPLAAMPAVVRIAVVGAHLRGMPLNHQLTSRGASFVESTYTAEEYRLYALTNSTPPKPALVRVSSGEIGWSIAVELWDVPEACFGSFVAEIPPPLGIGSLALADGRMIKGFICEPYGIDGARDISSYGGWRAYMSSLKRISPQP
jgi:allophanate hydrolase